jgi:hypothetical protein
MPRSVIHLADGELRSLSRGRRDCRVVTMLRSGNVNLRALSVTEPDEPPQGFRISMALTLEADAAKLACRL